MKQTIKNMLGNICLIMVMGIGTGVPLSNPALTNTQLLVMHWPVYMTALILPAWAQCLKDGWIKL